MNEMIEFLKKQLIFDEAVLHQTVNDYDGADKWGWVQRDRKEIKFKRYIISQAAVWVDDEGDTRAGEMAKTIFESIVKQMVQLYSHRDGFKKEWETL